MPKVWNKRDPNCPKDAVYVGRPSKWGNPFKIGEFDGIHPQRMDRTEVVQRYRDWIYYGVPKPILEQWVKELKGKDLVCWCAPLPCHADVLLELANQEASSHG